jgi:hypothetical protein
MCSAKAIDTAAEDVDLISPAERLALAMAIQ